MFVCPHTVKITHCVPTQPVFYRYRTKPVLNHSHFSFFATISKKMPIHYCYFNKIAYLCRRKDKCFV